jgi:2-polyprenyl-6-methoxyphenol hydroxylase-like FAD-dependent oxidoreductase
VAERLLVRCCIAGGGPAGMLLAYLLARAGVEVVVVEKHGDFLRDFRGDTVHPSTLEVMDELGLLDDLLALPHSKIQRPVALIDDVPVTLADFSRLPTRCKFIAMMPQWDFLNFIASKAAQYPTFRLRMNTEVTDLLFEHDTVVGVRATTPEGELEAQADLVVGCDGRSSVVRERSGLTVTELGSPMDVVWFRVSRQPGDPTDAFGGIRADRAFILINRPEHWQCGYVIAKGGLELLRTRGLAAFRDDLASFAPFLADRLDEITSWDDIALLSVRVDRLEQWYRPGLLCIGDAAHAMSPAGGVGINLAIQDAVATANLLTEPLRSGIPTVDQLRKVQRRREWPTRITQRVQVIIGERGLKPLVMGNGRQSVLWKVAPVLRQLPGLARLNGRMIGLGARPEHVKIPKVPQNM